MSTERRERRRGGFAPFLWGGLFLFCGIVVFLQAAGALPWSLWGSLWRFWPVLIVLIGLSFVVPRQRPWLMALIVLALVGAGIGVLLAMDHAGFPSDLIHTERYTVPLYGVTKADVTIDFSAGSLILDNVPRGSANLVEASPEIRNQRSTMQGSFSKTGDIGVLVLKAVNQQYWGGGTVHWMLEFTRSVPIDIKATCSAATVNFELQYLQVRSLALDMNASSGQMILPDYAGTAAVSVQADVSNLEITAPAGVAVQIRAVSSLSVVDVDQTRFPRQGDYYVSPDYDSASHRVALDITCDVGRITVK